MKINQITLFLFLTFFFFLSSCEKNYNCVCSNPGGEFDSISFKTSKKKAHDECDNYYNQNYNTMPWNETHCEIR